MLRHAEFGRSLPAESWPATYPDSARTAAPVTQCVLPTMSRGKYLGAETRPLNVTVDVKDLDPLKKLQIVTERNTSDVVRIALKTYIATNRHKLWKLVRK